MSFSSDSATHSERLARAEASAPAPSLKDRRIDQLINVLSPDSSHVGHESSKAVAVETLAGMSPGSVIEAMLAVQMVAIDDAAMGCLKRSALSRLNPGSDDRDLGYSIKLLNLFNRQIDALLKLKALDLAQKSQHGLSGHQSRASLLTPEERKAELANVIQQALEARQERMARDER